MKVLHSKHYIAASLAAATLILVGCSAGGSGAPPVGPGYTAGATRVQARPHDQQRSITEFINAQGTFCAPEAWGVPPGAIVVNGCIIYVPPVANFGGWGTLKTTSWCPVGIPLASVDYAGLANDYIVSQGGASLNTTFSGSVSEHSNSDGTGDVTVNLNTKNALAWGGCDPNGSPSGFDFATATLMFGNQAPAILGAATPALANSQLQIKFSEPQVGARMPDFLEIGVTPGYNLESEKFHAEADGPLQSAYGVPGGTAGHLVITETGTLHSKGKALQGYGFTADKIQITTK